jgi:hypothetical protein
MARANASPVIMVLPALCLQLTVNVWPAVHSPALGTTADVNGSHCMRIMMIFDYCSDLEGVLHV